MIELLNSVLVSTLYRLLKRKGVPDGVMKEIIFLNQSPFNNTYYILN